MLLVEKKKKFALKINKILLLRWRERERERERERKKIDIVITNHGMFL